MSLTQTRADGGEMLVPGPPGARLLDRTMRVGSPWPGDDAPAATHNLFASHTPMAAGLVEAVAIYASVRDPGGSTWS